MPESVPSFDRAIAAERIGPDRFAVVGHDSWGVPGAALNGGFVLSAATGALREALDSPAHPDPMTVSMTYERPILPGPIEVLTEAGRTGRRISFGTATVRQDGAEVARLQASFADLSGRLGTSYTAGAAPALPPPEECVELFEGIDAPQVGLMQQFEYRYAERPGWVTGTPGGVPKADFWMRFADGREPDSLSAVGLVDMACPGVFELGIFQCPTVELTVHVRARPAPGWLACRVWTTYLQGGYHEEEFELWDSAGTLIAQSRQLAISG